MPAPARLQRRLWTPETREREWQIVKELSADLLAPSTEKVPTRRCFARCSASQSVSSAWQSCHDAHYLGWRARTVAAASCTGHSSLECCTAQSTSTIAKEGDREAVGAHRQSCGVGEGRREHGQGLHGFWVRVGDAGAAAIRIIHLQAASRASRTDDQLLQNLRPRERGTPSSVPSRQDYHQRTSAMWMILSFHSVYPWKVHVFMHIHRGWSGYVWGKQAACTCMIHPSFLCAKHW